MRANGRLPLKEPTQEVPTMIYIGIDVHKKMCVVCLQDETGEVIAELEIENKKSGFEKLLQLVKGKEAKAVMESTANLWIRLYTELEAAGIKVVLSNPSRNRIIAESVKVTDRVCARMLATLLRTGFIAQCHVPPPEVRAMRVLIRYRTKLVQDLTRVKNRIHSILQKYELPPCECTDLFGKKGVQWLEMVVPLVDPGDQFVLGMELSRISELKGCIEQVEQRIASQAVITEEVTTLMSITGVDYFTAMLFLCEISDINRFPSASKLTSWLGLVPRVHQSGETVYQGRITKRGSPLVRWALIQAAQVAVRHDPYWAEKFNRISSRRGSQIAYVAIARELAVTMYHMLKRNEPYRYTKQLTYERKLKNLERFIRKAQTNRGEAPLQCFSS